MIKKLLAVLFLSFTFTVALNAQVEFIDYTDIEYAIETPGEVVVIEFWAEWNADNAYNLESLQGAYLYRIDADYNRKALEAYQVKSLPTVLIFYSGELVHTDRSDISFAKREAESHLQEIINRYL